MCTIGSIDKIINASAFLIVNVHEGNQDPSDPSGIGHQELSSWMTYRNKTWSLLKASIFRNFAEDHPFAIFESSIMR